MKKSTYPASLPAGLLLTGVVLSAVAGLSCFGGADAKAGKVVYAQYCEACHGEEGDGRGPAASLLKTRPRDFTKGVFEFRSTHSGRLPTDADLVRTIERGVPGTAMPSWKNLPIGKVRSVAFYLKTFSPRWHQDAPTQPISIPPIPEALGSSASAARGSAVYLKAGCWECHGGPGVQNGVVIEYPWGEGPKSPGLVDDHQEPIRAVDIRTAKLQGGISPQDLYRTLVTGMDGTPMPSYVDSLTPDEIWDLVSYTLALRRRGEG